MKITIISLLSLLFLVFLGLILSGNAYVLRAVAKVYLRGNTGVGIEDYKRFDNRVVEAGNYQPWAIAENYNNRQLPLQLEEAHQRYQSVAWLVIKSGAIIEEHYWDIGSENSMTNSFSMAKSFVTLCMFKAIEEGYIDSLQQPVEAFFEEFKGTGLTVGDLSRMSSGLDWEEEYTSPFSHNTEAYFGTDLKKLMLETTVVKAPGKNYEYLSGNTTLLAMIVGKATKSSLSAYCSKHFWKPMGAKHQALWMLDRQDGLEKAYCCFNSNARDYARWGQLTLNLGRWKNVPLLDSSWYKLALTPGFKETPFYGYSFWLDETEAGEKVYLMRGILGQYIIAVPEKQVVIVRLGHKRGEKVKNPHFPDDYYIWLQEGLNAAN